MKQFTTITLHVLNLVLFTLTHLNAQDNLPWLKTDSGRIIDETAKTVVLRGINLGGWLAEETWMMPFKTHPPEASPFLPIKDRIALWRTFEMRFGTAEMNRIRSALRNAWITDADFAKIKAAGLNCVRLPFLFDLMEEPNGLFPYLDRALESANRYGLYVILDMHGAPGRQSGKSHTGEENFDRLFFDGAMVKKTVEIWGKIAERYKDRSVVAGYDILNEPMGAPDITTLCLVEDQIYRAIRAHDAKHIVFFEDGFKGIDRLPDPAIVGWENVVFSTHTYTHNKESKNEFVKSVQSLMTTVQAKQAVTKTPMYFGEFNVEPYGKAEMIKEFITNLQAKDISWSIWSYKMAGVKGRGSFWGLYSAPKHMKRINPFTDTREEIFKKIQLLRTENFEQNKELIEVFRVTAQINMR